MGPPIQQVRAMLSDRFLGRGGVHGIGLDPSSRAIRVSVDVPMTAEQDAILDQLRSAADPYRVVVIREERPVFH